MTGKILRHARTLRRSEFAQRTPVNTQHEVTGICKLRRQEKCCACVGALSFGARFERLARMPLRRIGTLSDLAGPMRETGRVRLAIEKVAIMLRDEERRFVDRVRFRFDLVNAAVRE